MARKSTAATASPQSAQAARGIGSQSETRQKTLFDEADHPVVPVTEVPDLDFERSRRRLPRGA